MEKLNPKSQIKELLINGSVVKVELGEGRLKPKLCFLGPLGTYTEDAVRQLLGEDRKEGMDEELLKSNGEVVRMVDSLKYDIGVVAVENSTEGNVMETIRELVQAKGTKILGEIIIPIQHMLIGRTNEEITKILSHPQALGQCSNFLASDYPEAERVAVTSTSLAAEMVKTIPGAAAIGSRSAAERNQLSILTENIGDNRYNSTRFLLIGRGETPQTGEDTTTLIFTVEDRVGILYDCLGVFVYHGLNLTKIDSHPTGKMREYMFLVSLDGHQKDENVAQAFNSLGKRYSTSLKILGSYKKAELPKGVREPSVINDSY